MRGSLSAYSIDAVVLTGLIENIIASRTPNNCFVPIKAWSSYVTGHIARPSLDRYNKSIVPMYGGSIRPTLKFWDYQKIYERLINR